MTITLRPALADDLMWVGALHRRSRVIAYQGIVPVEALSDTTEEMMGRWWVERWTYERDTHRLTVAEHGGRRAGFTYVGPDETSVGPDEHPDPAMPAVANVGMLYAIHLEPAEQGHGVGRALMIDALSTLHGLGWRRAALWVLAENLHARRFYERGGWAPDGAERESAVGSAPTHQLRYVRDLP